MINIIDMKTKFTLDLLYAECALCGQPVIWPGKDNLKVLKMAGIDPSDVDETCMIVSKGCPACRPDKNSFATQVVRLKEEPAERTFPAEMKTA